MPATYSPRLAHGGLLDHRPRAPALILLVTLFACLGFIFALSFVMNRFSLELAVAIGLAVVFTVLCFVRVKWVLYAFIFACLFSPEIQLGGMLGRASKRAVTLRVEDILLVVLAVNWLARTALVKTLGLTLRTPLNRPIILYALACVLATLVGIGYGWVQEQLAAVLFVLKYIQYFVIFFVILNLTETRRDVRHMVVWAVVTYLAVCLFGFAQIPGGLRPTAFAEYHSEPNTLAGYLVFMVGICSGLLLSARSARSRLMWTFLVLLGLVLIAFTLSRSGWAGLFGVALVLVLIGRHKYAVLATLLIMGTALALFSFEVDWLPHTVRQRVHQTAGVVREEWPGMPQPVRVFGFELDPSASERIRSYQAALQKWSDVSRRHWLPFVTGSGVLGGRKFVDGQYVRVIAETGLLGLAAFLALLYTIWHTGWRAYTESRVGWHRGLALGYLAGFAGLAVHALGANTFIIVRIMEPFFIFTALMALLPEIKPDKGEDEAIHPVK